jgi:Family of unknown function (DUF5808)
VVSVLSPLVYAVISTRKGDFSKRDRRLWVPKRQPGMGWTLNFAHRAAGLLIVGFSVISTAIVVLIFLVVLSAMKDETVMRTPYILTQ